MKIQSFKNKIMNMPLEHKYKSLNLLQKGLDEGAYTNTEFEKPYKSLLEWVKNHIAKCEKESNNVN